VWKISILALSIFTFNSFGVDSKISENYFYNSGFDSATKLSHFIKELQHDVSIGNKDLVALKISYPLTVHFPDSMLGINNSSDFIKHYDVIITESVKRVILSQSMQDLGRFAEGVRLGHGEVWVGSVKRHVSDEYKIKVITINVRNGT
jgi:hypothetical protein